MNSAVLDICSVILTHALFVLCHTCHCAAIILQSLLAAKDKEVRRTQQQLDEALQAASIANPNSSTSLNGASTSKQQQQQAFRPASPLATSSRQLRTSLSKNHPAAATHAEEIARLLKVQSGIKNSSTSGGGVANSSGTTSGNGAGLTPNGSSSSRNGGGGKPDGNSLASGIAAAEGRLRKSLSDSRGRTSADNLDTLGRSVADRPLGRNSSGSRSSAGDPVPTQGLNTSSSSGGMLLLAGQGRNGSSADGGPGARSFDNSGSGGGRGSLRESLGRRSPASQLARSMGREELRQLSFKLGAARQANRSGGGISKEGIAGAGGAGKEQGSGRWERTLGDSSNSGAMNKGSLSGSGSGWGGPSSDGISSSSSQRSRAWAVAAAATGGGGSANGGGSRDGFGVGSSSFGSSLRRPGDLISSSSSVTQSKQQRVAAAAWSSDSEEEAGGRGRGHTLPSSSGNGAAAAGGSGAGGSSGDGGTAASRAKMMALNVGASSLGRREALLKVDSRVRGGGASADPGSPVASLVTQSSSGRSLLMDIGRESKGRAQSLGGGCAAGGMAASSGSGDKRPGNIESSVLRSGGGVSASWDGGSKSGGRPGLSRAAQLAGSTKSLSVSFKK